MREKSLWTPLNHLVLRHLRAHVGEGRRVGIGLSGGRDSVLLAQILSEISSVADLRIVVLHVHHGVDPTDPAQSRFRDQAASWVREWARIRKLEFVEMRAPDGLRGEAAFRKIRRDFFGAQREERGLSAVFLGHHAEDLLETRLLRLIRGTSISGLEAMREDGGEFQRPFLTVSRAQIQQELEQRKLVWLEDPSNLQDDYFRNWIRESWLPQLEAKSPGATQSLGRSLQSLVDEQKAPRDRDDLWVSEVSLSRPVYLQLPPHEQRRSLAQLISRIKPGDYSQGQIEEIQRRLDKSQSEHNFCVAALDFRVSARRIEVEPARLSSVHHERS